MGTWEIEYAEPKSGREPRARKSREEEREPRVVSDTDFRQVPLEHTLQTSYGEQTCQGFCGVPGVAFDPKSGLAYFVAMDLPLLLSVGWVGPKTAVSVLMTPPSNNQLYEDLSGIALAPGPDRASDGRLVLASGGDRLLMVYSLDGTLLSGPTRVKTRKVVGVAVIPPRASTRGATCLFLFARPNRLEEHCP
mmetsp:Transcript_11469/g.36325  ORF Transcript_11469/g.36325 Transcript_11469/m.36325 type:complete len:192 (+) Transcript_11469:3053-3628(+)